MLNFIRKLIHKYFFFQFIASKTYALLYFLSNKKKIKIYYDDECWIHETYLGKYATTHPTKNAENYLTKELRFFLKYYKCKKGDIIFDAGAGIGTEVLFFSKYVGNTGRVYALEANPTIYRLLKKTISLNNLYNVIVINEAVYDKSGKILNFVADSQSWLGGKIETNKSGFKVRTITFDDIIKKFNIKKIDFAKFNIEGAEKYLNCDKMDFIKICKNVCISCHDFLKDNKLKTFNILKKNLLLNKFKIFINEKNIKKVSKDKLYYIFAFKN